MDIEHIMGKEDYIARMKMRILKEQSVNNLQKLNPYYILLLDLYNAVEPSKARILNLSSLSFQQPDAMTRHAWAWGILLLTEE